MSKGSKWYSITRFKCPRCHEGDLYPTPLFSFRKPFTMNDQCAVCGQEYVLEPGFYWGAMYIAYMLSSGLMLGGFAIVFFLFGTTILQTFFIMGGIVAILYVPIFRLARAIWINLYVHYDPSINGRNEPS